MESKVNMWMVRLGVFFPILGSIAIVIICTLIVTPTKVAVKKEQSLKREQAQLGYETVSVVDYKGWPEDFELDVTEGVIITDFDRHIELDNDTLTIPDTLMDQPVVGIAERVFSSSYAPEIQHVIFPSTLQFIGYEAFYLQKIETLEIPENIKYIGADAFASNQITKLTFNEGIEYIGTGAFQYNDITSVTIPASVSYIGKLAFYYNTHLSNVIFSPNDYDTGGIINAQAFPACEGANIVIPGNYTDIRSGNFGYAASITWEASNDGSGQVYNALGVYTNEFHGTPTIEKIGDQFGNKNNIIIYGSAGSYLEQFAEENGYKFSTDNGSLTNSYYE